MRPLVQVGKKLELTNDEVRELEELTANAHRLLRTRPKGWMLAYVQGVTAQSKIIRRGLERSHAS